MSLSFPTEFKELVRSRTNLVDLVGQSIALTPTRGGSDHVGLCPFHDDKDPSFHVYPERQSYRCWACSEGGDCFSFIQKIEGLSFPETVKRLAELAGLEIPQEFVRSKAKSSNRDQLYAALKWAEEQYHWYLMNSSGAGEAKDYLTGRGYSEETINQFQLGYHPNDWSWLIDRARDVHSMKNLLASRLIGQRPKDNGYYDNFVDRVMFPIRDDRGRTVAFGGRILPGREEGSKYWNSPESELFSKSRLLYAFDVAKQSLRTTKTALVTEGYTDCISCHIHGVTNVVATLGTALTEHHVSLLKRFVRKVVIVFDADRAGKEAAEKSISKFMAEEIDLRILTLPGGQDPADYLAENGKDAFNQLVEDAPEALEYKLESLFNRLDGNSIDGRQQILDQMLGLLASAPGMEGSLRENLIFGKLAWRLQLGEPAVRTRCGELREKAKQKTKRFQPKAQSNPQPKPQPKQFKTSNREYDESRYLPADDYDSFDGPSQQDMQYTRFDEPQTIHDEANESPQPTVHLTNRTRWEEQEVIEIILSVPEKVGVIRQHIGPDDFHDPQLRRLLELCFDLAEQGVSPSINSVTAALENPELKSLVLQVDAKRIEKEIELKISDSKPASKEAGALPAFITQALDNLKLRRAKQSVEVSKQQIARNATPGTLDSDTIESLRRAQEFHRQRAT
ncbi:DNA primase [bacterium]|nr:DNA primase [bacterium]